MDSTSQLKKNLISRIKESKDVNFLSALQTIFDSSEQELYQLTNEQEASIEISRAELQEGKFRKNDQVISELREWFQKK
ncbi:conserved hypothetical protein [Flavobacterium sp. 9R]|uniref:hypothetical protein n=1 Tax=Flavobacterium sp. 9R TaxID=2653143 RepID=UPI0012F0EC43|nr:hypothetical protein [Flavobacterium sp. 9R]VXB22900.1 conserved hypothetical protein [Flavobacterium sp. 9R]